MAHGDNGDDAATNFYWPLTKVPATWPFILMMPVEKNSEKEPWGIATFKRNKKTAIRGGAVARDLGSELWNAIHAESQARLISSCGRWWEFKCDAEV